MREQVPVYEQSKVPVTLTANQESWIFIYRCDGPNPNTRAPALVNVLTNSKSFNSSRIPMYKGFADQRSVEEFLRQCNRELIAQEIPKRKWVKSITPLFTNFEVMVVIERKYGKRAAAQ